MDIGVQLFSLKDYFSQSPGSTFQRLADIGYSAVEMPLDLSGENRFGMGEISPEDLATELQNHGLQLISTHLQVTEDEQFEPAIEFNLAAGCHNAVIPLELLHSHDQAKALADRLNALGERFSRHGVHLLYHNHFQEFQRFEGQTAYEVLIERTDPQHVSSELDTYWAMRGGADVLALLDRLGSRCKLLHQKDMPAGLSPTNILSTLEPGSSIDLQTIADHIKPELFIEIGKGIMPIAEIVSCARRRCHTEAIIVEVDATAIDEFDSVASSFQNLSLLMRNLDKSKL